MNIQQLEYIIAVDNHRHFSKAADASFVTQPTLSMMIQKLEDELNVKIFDRSQIPIHPTDIGRKIIDQARITVSQIKQIKDIIDEEKEIVKGNFRLGIIPTVSPYLLSKLTHEHTSRNVDIHITIREMTTDQIISMLLNDSIDGAILATPLNHPSLVERPLYYERFWVYVSPKEKELYAKGALTERDLANANLWMLDEVHCMRSQIVNLCNLKRKQRSHSLVTFEAGSIETLIHIVDSNTGVTVIPEMAIETLSETQKKNIRPFKDSTPVREISLVTRKEYLRERMLAFIENEITSPIPSTMKDSSLKKYVVKL